MKFNHPLYNKLDKYKFILCSSSPRRLELLQQIGINPIIKKSNFPENLNKLEYKGNEIQYVIDTSYAKLEDVYNSIEEDANIILLSADTVIISNGEIFEKPGNYENNVKMLKKLCYLQNEGYKIKIVTCCTLLKREDNKVSIKKFQCISEIEMIEGISNKDIENYCKSEEGFEVAGGFKIQGFGSILFKGIKGDYYNCVGLPISMLFKELCSFL